MKKLLCSAAVMALAACAAPSQTAQITAAPAEALSGSWNVLKIGATVLADHSGTKLTFDSAKNAFSGNAGCNNLFGGYTAANGSLKFGGVASTRMACFAPIMTREKIMIEALNRTAAYGFDNGALVLLDAQNKPLLKAVRSAGM